jgi:hypothetical protein
MDSSENDTPSTKQPRWRWRAEFKPGMFLFSLNDEPFSLYCTPTIEPLGEDRDLLTLQIVLKRNGRQHWMDAISRQTLRRPPVLIGLAQALLNIQRDKALEAQGDEPNGHDRERRNSRDTHQPI